MNKIENGSSNISNFIQGNLYGKRNLYADKITIPHLLFFDDAEINNPLGSHPNDHSMGAVYCLCLISFHVVENYSIDLMDDVF